MNDWTPPLPPLVRQRLIDLVGLAEPDQQDPLHVSLANTVLRTQPYSEGAVLAALRHDYTWALREEGRVFAESKSRYEHLSAKAKAKLLLEDPKLSVAKAEVLVEADDEVYAMLVEYRLAEQRERAVRKALDTLENQIEVWRTGQANQRAADRATAQGMDGSA